MIFIPSSEAPHASVRGICAKAKRNCAEANPPSLYARGASACAARATARSPVAIPSRAFARGILAKASEQSGEKHPAF